MTGTPGTPPVPEGLDPPVPEGVDPAVPSPARLYDYYLGGTNNYPVDREVGERVRALAPELTEGAWANRGFHQRAARWLVAEHGIRQFIDIGSGLPTAGNTHEVVHQVDPAARVVYVDIDPIVLAHSRHLLAGEENTTAILGDLRDPDGVLGHPAVRALIDPGEPTGLMMTWVMHFVADSWDPWGLVARYVRQLAPGSFLVLSHVAHGEALPRGVRDVMNLNAQALGDLCFRSKGDIERFFAGMSLVPPRPGAAPGVVHAGAWGADDPLLAGSDGSRWSYCGVARRP